MRHEIYKRSHHRERKGQVPTQVTHNSKRGLTQLGAEGNIGQGGGGGGRFGRFASLGDLAVQPKSVGESMISVVRVH